MELAGVAAGKGVIATVPIDLILNVAVGSSMALASHTTLASQKLWRTPALWALVLFELFVFVPIGAYLLVRYPEWSLMYLLDADSLPLPDHALALLYALVALGAFLGARQLLLTRRVVPVVGIVAGSLLLSLAVVYIGRDNLLVVGSTQAFRSAPETMRGVIGSQLSYVLGGAGVAVAIGWGAALWRLFLLSRAQRPHLSMEAPTVVREEDQKKKKKKAGPKKRRAS